MGTCRFLRNHAGRLGRRARIGITGDRRRDDGKSVAPGTLPPENAASVVVPPVTTGVDVVAVGAVTVTTFDAPWR